MQIHQAAQAKGVPFRRSYFEPCMPMFTAPRSHFSSKHTFPVNTVYTCSTLDYRLYAVTLSYMAIEVCGGAWSRESFTRIRFTILQ